jgi:hypothetical protein
MAGDTFFAVGLNSNDFLFGGLDGRLFPSDLRNLFRLADGMALRNNHACSLDFIIPFNKVGKIPR